MTDPEGTPLKISPLLSHEILHQIKHTFWALVASFGHIYFLHVPACQNLAFDSLNVTEFVVVIGRHFTLNNGYLSTFEEKIGSAIKIYVFPALMDRTWKASKQRYCQTLCLKLIWADFISLMTNHARFFSLQSPVEDASRVDE